MCEQQVEYEANEKSERAFGNTSTNGDQCARDHSTPQRFGFDDEQILSRYAQPVGSHAKSNPIGRCFVDRLFRRVVLHDRLRRATFVELEHTKEAKSRLLD